MPPPGISDLDISRFSTRNQENHDLKHQGTQSRVNERATNTETVLPHPSDTKKHTQTYKNCAAFGANCSSKEQGRSSANIQIDANKQSSDHFSVSSTLLQDGHGHALPYLTR